MKVEKLIWSYLALNIVLSVLMGSMIYLGEWQLFDAFSFGAISNLVILAALCLILYMRSKRVKQDERVFQTD